MSSNPPTWKPASNAEEEKQRFDSFMADFLKEDDTPPKGNQPPSNSPPSQPSGNGGGGFSLSDVEKLLNDRDQRAENDKRHKELSERVEKLEKSPERKKKPWWSPLS